MNQPRQGNGGYPGSAYRSRPLCWNKEPMRRYRANDGRHEFKIDPVTLESIEAQRTTTIEWNFSRGCKSWASDPSTDPVPMKEGWRCDGCLHYPAELVALAEQRREDRFSRAPAAR